MHRTLGILLLILSLPIWAADPTGKWKATASGPDGQTFELEFQFKVEDGKLTGTITGPRGERPISDAKVAGDKITFAIDFDGNKIVHSGTVTDDEMKLKVTFGDRDMEMNAKRERR